MNKRKATLYLLRAIRKGYRPINNGILFETDNDHNFGIHIEHTTEERSHIIYSEKIAETIFPKMRKITH